MTCRVISDCGARRPGAAWRLSVLLCVTAPFGALASQTTVIGQHAGCPTCTIELARVARIGSPHDSVYYSMALLAVAEDSRGFLYVGPRHNAGPQEHLIDVYDRSGKRIRSIARLGSGPQETETFRTFLRASGDTLLLMGRGGLTIVTMDGTIVQKLPTAPVRGVSNGVFLGGGNVLIAAPSLASDGTMRTMHVLSLQSGRVLRSIGHPDPSLGSGYEAVRYVGGGKNGIWAVRMNRFEMELWSPDGRLVRKLLRDADWFQAWTENYTPERGPGRLQPILRGILEDENGFLWLCVLVPRDRSVQYPTRRDQPIKRFDTSGDYYDTIIEVIDPRTNKLLVSRRLPRVVRGFFPGGLMVQVVEAEDAPYLYVFRVRLSRP